MVSPEYQVECKMDIQSILVKYMLKTMMKGDGSDCDVKGVLRGVIAKAGGHCGNVT